MPRLVPQWLCLVTLAVSAITSAAHAKPFDLIYADRIEVTTYPVNSGFTLGNDIGLVVNRGTSDITASDLAAVTFNTSSSDPAVVAEVSILNEGHPLVGPIHSMEAVGTLTPGSPLPALVMPGETLRNTYPVGVMWLGMGYPVWYSGTVVVDVTMTMGTDVAHYLLTVHFTAGSDYAISVTRGSRLSSQPATTAARNTSWAAIKRLYR